MTVTKDLHLDSLGRGGRHELGNNGLFARHLSEYSVTLVMRDPFVHCIIH